MPRKGWRRPEGKPRQAICVICGDQFVTTHNHQKICASDDCAAEAERKYSRDYYARNRKAHKKRIQTNRDRWPEKYAARSAVQEALKRGRLVRQPCKNCGTTERVHAHHHDYTKPLDVEWMCVPCHWVEHHKAEEAIAA